MRCGERKTRGTPTSKRVILNRPISTASVALDAGREHECHVP
ncbi:hypothetical protein BN903_5 [Halorubrum sp. AJ67]|nr:hypothetical protein BN903_5 [Halorubrum sp. AJ67]